MKKSITAITKETVSMIREVTFKYKTLKTERIKIDNPPRVAMFIRQMIEEEVNEHFIVLCINNKNEVVGYSTISIGTVSEAIIHPREVFLPAVYTKASGIIVAHNHPSGSHIPSKQDIDTTKRLVEAGKIMGIPLVDHIIIGFADGDNYYSMKEHDYIQ